MDTISDLAPLLLHMTPGDVSGPRSHEWMMTSLPDTHQHDWALELIGSVIKYPFAVEIFVPLVRLLEAKLHRETYCGRVVGGGLVEAASTGPAAGAGFGPLACGSHSSCGSPVSGFLRAARADRVGHRFQGSCIFM